MLSEDVLSPVFFSRPVSLSEEDDDGPLPWILVPTEGVRDLTLCSVTSGVSSGAVQRIVRGSFWASVRGSVSGFVRGVFWVSVRGSVV